MLKFILFHNPLATITHEIAIFKTVRLFKSTIKTNQNLLNRSHKAIPAVAKPFHRPSSTSAPSKYTVSLPKLLSLLLGTSVVLGVYVLQDRKRRRPPLIKKKPPPKPRSYKLPPTVPFLIIGAGTAAHAAARAIRASDADNRVLVVGDECYPPYLRPPLSKELWFTEDADKVDRLVFQSFSGRTSDLFWEQEGYYCEPEDLLSLEHGGTAVALGLKAIKIDTEKQVVWFNDGQNVEYDKCLLATGVRPKTLQVLHKNSSDVTDRVLQLRSIDDFKRLMQVSRAGRSVAVVGEGASAAEISCALANKGLGNISLITPEKGVLAHLLPDYLSRWATSKVRQEGVRVVEGSGVVGARFDWFADQVVLKLTDQSEMRADYVLESVGLQVNDELAHGTDIQMDDQHGGFLADGELKAGKNLWVAGDAASFMDEAYGRRRLDHHNNAFFTGRLAGGNMCGEGRKYWQQQTFWADLGASSAFQAVGIVDSSLPTVAVFAHKKEGGGTDGGGTDGRGTDGGGTDGGGKGGQSGESSVEERSVLRKGCEDGKKGMEKNNETVTEDLDKGVVFYEREGVIVGVLLWNLFNADHTAKTVLHQQSCFSDYAQLAELFKLYDPAGPDD